MTLDLDGRILVVAPYNDANLPGNFGLGELLRIDPASGAQELLSSATVFDRGLFANPFAAAVVPAPLSVAIDVRPNVEPNVIRLGSRGEVPVAILSGDGFDVRSVDPAAVVFAGAAALQRPSGRVETVQRDVDGDGRRDLVLRFAIAALELTAGHVEATLGGATFAGRAIEGRDEVAVFSAIEEVGVFPGERYATPTAVNARGEMVGSAEVEATVHAFHWHGGVFSDLGTLRGPGDREGFSIATAIDNGRAVVGGSEDADFAFHAFLFENGVMTDIPPPGSRAAMRPTATARARSSSSASPWRAARARSSSKAARSGT